MNKFRAFAAKAAATVLAASMIFQGTAFAAPIDELNEIMEKQEENSVDSLMEETLGFSALGDAIDDNGLQFQIKAGLLPQTFELLSEGSAFTEKEAELLKNGYALLGLQIDPKQEKWQLNAGAGSAEEALLDASLYGDKQQLALSLPQFYAGALSLKAGNLKEQIMGSALAGIFGITEENAAQIPEVDMSFYPEDSEAPGIFDGMEERLEEKMEGIEDRMQVEKTESGDVTTYAASMDTADIMDIYKIVFDEYLSFFETASAPFYFSATDSTDLSGQIDQMLSEMGSVLGDTVTVDFDVRDGLVEKISYELYLDTTPLEQTAADMEETAGETAEKTVEEVVEEVVEEAGLAENAVSEAQSETAADTAEQTEAPAQIVEVEESFQGYVSYEITFNDPAQPQKGMQCKIDMTDAEKTEMATVLVDYVNEREAATETDTVTVDVQENGESVYSGTVFTSIFNAETGDFDVVISVEDTDSVEMKLDSTFTSIEKGKSFVLTVDELSMTVDGETVGLNGELQVSSDPGTITAPADSKSIFELTQGGILDLVNEVTANAQAWEAQFMPAPETEAMTEVVAEAETEAIAE